MQSNKKNVINYSDWDKLVSNSYNRPYAFQQQDGCKERGTHSFSVPFNEDNIYLDPYTNDTISEDLNDEEMGVSFKSWLSRNPEQQLQGCDDNFSLEFWWQRNFYPDVNVIANDLFKKGLIEAGDYIINIDW